MAVKIKDVSHTARDNRILGFNQSRRMVLLKGTIPVYVSMNKILQ